MASHELYFHDEALAEWHALDPGVKSRLKKKLENRLENPLVDSARLSGDLSGLFVIRLHTDGIRLIYRVNQNERKITVASVGRREDLKAYKSAAKRLSD